MPNAILAAKVCTRCSIEKQATTDNFSPLKRGVYGLQVWCKPCCAAQKRESRLSKPEIFAEIERLRHLKNGETRNAKNRERWAANREKYLATAAKRIVVKAEEYNSNRREKLASNPEFAAEKNKKQREWLSNNSQSVSLQRKERWANLPKEKKLRTYIGAAMSHSLRGKSKGGKGWQEIVGYTTSDLVQHLEKKFLVGMEWGNYGTHWHVDHIKPVASFDINGVGDQLLSCWALSNLQPLWATDNMRKGAKLNWSKGQKT